MRKIGLCGGTFDPLHLGHVALVKAALASGKIDLCYVMPAGRPPHKLDQIVSPAAYRLSMVEKAFADISEVIVSDMEIHQRGRSYTLDTVQRLQPLLEPDDELILIYGSDILIDLEKWYRPQDILDRCPLLLARRGGYNHEETDRLADRIKAIYQARIEFFDCPAIDLSSHAIREAIEHEQPWQDMVPDPVKKFIEKHQFYHYAAVINPIKPETWHQLLDYESLIWPMMDRKRLLHSLNVMYVCLELAQIHHQPLEQAGLAGMLHDSAKYLPQKKQLALAKQAGDKTMLTKELAHAPAGMILAKTELGLDKPEDEAVLQAIFCHTTGCPDMTDLAKILFLADKIEPSRHYERLQPIRDLARIDLDQAMLLCIEEIHLYLRRTHQKPHPYTLALVKNIQRGQ